MATQSTSGITGKPINSNIRVKPKWPGSSHRQVAPTNRKLLRAEG